MALIAIGSNCGDRASNCARAVGHLSDSEHAKVVRVSRWHETSAVGGQRCQNPYLNGAALIETTLSPPALLMLLQDTEHRLGRVRTERWGPRTIDLDLLLYDELEFKSAGLTLPHPRMAFRRFVLEPAAQIAPDMVHPAIGWHIDQLLAYLNSAPPFVAISSDSVQRACELASAAAAACSWQVIGVPKSLCNVKDLSSSPSFTPQVAVEFLRNWAPDSPAPPPEITPRAAWGQRTNEGGWISPIWIDDLSSAVRLRWPDSATFVERAIASISVRPKLLAVFDGTLSRPGEMPSDEGDFHIRWNADRRSRAARKGIGPVLWLNDDQSLSPEQQLIAAIQSM